MHSLNSRADVVTERPERWAKQLASHFGTKIEVVSADSGHTLAFGAGQGEILPGDGVLVLHAHADDEAGLETVQRVLGGHLERFAAKDGLTVTWVRA